jgi:hypothetical protein
MRLCCTYVKYYFPSMCIFAMYSECPGSKSEKNKYIGTGMTKL